jgi:hypothetical protein
MNLSADKPELVPPLFRTTRFTVPSGWLGEVTVIELSLFNVKDAERAEARNETLV